MWGLREERDSVLRPGWGWYVRELRETEEWVYACPFEGAENGGSGYGDTSGGGSSNSRNNNKNGGGSRQDDRDHSSGGEGVVSCCCCVGEGSGTSPAERDACG